MTGFGKAEVVVNGKTFTAEIRSLNSKQLDLGLRMPAAYRELENEVRSIVSRRVIRGKVDLTVTVTSIETTSASRIDKELFAEYLHKVAVCGIKRTPYLFESMLAYYRQNHFNSVLRTVILISTYTCFDCIRKAHFTHSPLSNSLPF